VLLKQPAEALMGHGLIQHPLISAQHFSDGNV